jgi:hypothetical protein
MCLRTAGKIRRSTKEILPRADMVRVLTVAVMNHE